MIGLGSDKNNEKNTTTLFMKSMFIKEFIANLIVIHVLFSIQISLQEDKLLPKFEFDVAVL